MEALKAAVSEWLEYEDPSSQVIKTTEDDAHAPERPEVMDILLQLRRFGLSWSLGAYEDQPWLLYQELNAVCEAEEEHKAIKLINQENWIKAQQDAHARQLQRADQTPSEK